MDGPLKWHGGKHYLAPRIVELMPPRCKNPNAPSPDDPGYIHYVEPYFGGGSVLLANSPEGISEVANDINGRLTCFWSVLQDEEYFRKFYRRITATPFSQEEYTVSTIAEDCWQQLDPDEAAAEFFTHCRQSLSGRMDTFASISRNRTRRGMNEQVAAWLTTIDGLPEVHARMKRVLILNRPALEVIATQDGPRTLFYLDPPYMHETRTTTGEYGAHEMSVEDHRRLLMACSEIKGRFMLSGYANLLYDDFAKKYKWTRHEFELPNNAAGGKEKRRMIECLWCNFP